MYLLYPLIPPHSLSPPSPTLVKPRDSDDYTLIGSVTAMKRIQGHYDTTFMEPSQDAVRLLQRPQN